MRTERVIQSIVDLIVRCVDPETIMLFGSAAQGRARADSDIDLLVVSRLREPKPLRALELKGLLDSWAVPVDLHLRTPAEMEAEIRLPFSLAGTAVRHGIVLYKRRD